MCGFNSWLTFVFVLFLEGANSESSSTPFKDAQLLKDRGNMSFLGQVNITTFPSCAYTNCIASDQLSPARLGCVEPELSTSCLCDEAPTPLSCAPEGPSDQDNCWFELENWFAGVWNGSVPLVDSETLPECSRNCVLTFLRNEGCSAATRNCFCMLPKAPIVKAATDCWAANCSKKKVPGFAPGAWHDDICDLGNTAKYDQEKYDSYLAMVHKVRLSMPILVGIISVCMIVIGIFMCGEETRVVRAAVISIAVALVLLIIVPVYTAM